MTSPRRLVLPLAGVMLAGLVVMQGCSTAKTASSRSTYSYGPSCGATIRKADGTPWTCTFDDEFNDTWLDPTKWLAQTGNSTGDTLLGYACDETGPGNVSVSGGALHLTVRKTDQWWSCGRALPTNYTAGMVSTYHLFSQAYGRWEARIRTPATTSPGLHDAFWLWPDNRYVDINWPTTGEIDVAETYSTHPNVAVPYLHYTSDDNGGPIPGVNTAWSCTAQRGAWNTYDVVWTPTSITISVNGTTCLVNTSANPAFTQPYIVALTSGLGSAGDALTSATPLPATTDVDYVRVWK